MIGRLRGRLTMASAPTVAMVLLAVVFVVGTIGPPLTGQRTFVGVDLIYDVYPWQNLPDQPDSPTSDWGPVSDTVDGTTPARTLFAESVRDGDPLLWNPWIAGGTSHASTPISGVYNPLNFAYFVLPAHVAPAATKLVELVAAIGFTFAFLRRVGLRRPPALLGGIAFAGSGFMVMWTNWPQPGTAALIPALFWAAERMLQLRTMRSVVPLAVSVAAILLAGFPMVAVYGLTLLGPYVLVRTVRERRGTEKMGAGVAADLARSAGAVVLGVMLSAFAVLPFTEDLNRTDLGYRTSNEAILGLGSLITTIAPAGLGGSWTDAPYFGRANQVEAVSYLGVATVLLAAVGLWLGRSHRLRRGVLATVAAGAVVAVAAMYQGGPALDLLQELPLYETNSIGRGRSLLGFLAAVLAAIGLDALLDRRAAAPSDVTRSWVPPVSVLLRGAAVLIAAAIAGLVALDAARDRATAAGQREHLRDELIVAGIVGLVVVAAAVAASRRHRVVHAMGVTVVGAALVFQSVGFAWPVTPDVESDAFYPVVEDLDWLAAEASESRVAVEGQTLYPSANSLYRIRSVTGHTFHQQTWREMLLTADPDAFAGSQTLSRLANTPGVTGSSALDRLGVEFFVMTPQSAIPGVRSTLSTAQPGATVELGAGESVLRPVDEPLPRLRGISVTIDSVEIPTPYEESPMGRIEVLDEDGAVIVGNERRLDRRAADGSFLITLPTAPVAEADVAAIRFSVVGDAEVVLGAADDRLPALWLMESIDDGLDLVRAGDIVVFRRASAMPRIRWATESVVETDSESRRAMLGRGVVPADTVVLSEQGPDAAGASGEIAVAADEPERIDLDVTTEGAGYVVVADALQQGWVAEIDGERADLVEADHAGVAVFIPAGQHRVSLRYDAPGRDTGLAVTGVGWVAVAGLMLGPGIGRRLRRRSS